MEGRRRLQRLDFLFQERGDAVLCEVDLGEIDAEIALDALCGPLLDDVAIENLVVAGGDFELYPAEGGIDKVLVPLGIPEGVEFRAGGIGGASDGGGAGGVLGPAGAGLGGEALAELVCDAPAGDLEEPALEGAAGGIVVEAIRAAGDGEEGLLEGVVGLGIGEAGAAGEAVDEF